jgi:hypothetical protein
VALSGVLDVAHGACVVLRWEEDHMAAKPDRAHFRVTWDDCDWKYSRSSGPGGQNVNKRSTKVQCTHRESGATAVCQEHREQHRNREGAFKAMARTEKFQNWIRREVSRRSGALIGVEEAVAAALSPENLSFEGQTPAGKWEKISGF